MGSGGRRYYDSYGVRGNGGQPVDGSGLAEVGHYRVGRRVEGTGGRTERRALGSPEVPADGIVRRIVAVGGNALLRRIESVLAVRRMGAERRVLRHPEDVVGRVMVRRRHAHAVGGVDTHAEADVVEAVVLHDGEGTGHVARVTVRELVADRADGWQRLQRRQRRVRATRTEPRRRHPAVDGGERLVSGFRL